MADDDRVIVLTDSLAEKEQQVKDLQASVTRKDEVLKQVNQNFSTRPQHMSASTCAALNLLLLQMRASRDASKQTEAKLEQLQQAHADEVSKLKAELHRKQTALIAAKTQAEHLQSDMTTLKKDHEQACDTASERCQLADAKHMCAQKAGHVLFDVTVALCRMLLRSTAHMRSGDRSFSVPAPLYMRQQTAHIVYACR